MLRIQGIVFKSATMLSEILRDFALLSTVFAAIVSCEQFSEEILILDVSHYSLNLRLGEMYAIHNHATGLPLLHDRSGMNVTRPSHWWTLVHLEDNVYYLQIQEILANASAPRWDRRVRLEMGSTPGYYHLHPVSCFKFKDENNPKPDAYFYVDYFDENGRDNSECVGINSTRNGWITQLEEENIANMPRDVLNRKNFEYKFTPFRTALEDRVLESGKFMELAPPQSISKLGGDSSPQINVVEEEFIFPRLKLRESDSKPESLLNSWFNDVSSVSIRRPYDCACKNDINLENSYMVVSISYNFQLQIFEGSFPDKVSCQEPSFLKVTGYTGGKLGKFVSLSQPILAVFVEKDCNNMIGDVERPRIGDLVRIMYQNVNKSTEYVAFDKNEEDFKFFYESVHPTEDMFIGVEREDPFCVCEIISIDQYCVGQMAILLLLFVIALLLVRKLVIECSIPRNASNRTEHYIFQVREGVKTFAFLLHGVKTKLRRHGEGDKKLMLPDHDTLNL